MDNFTHALAGLLVAEAVVQVRWARRGEPPTHWRAAAYVVSALGNNLPDVDFMWTSLAPKPVGYLLHHRGHSHTLLAAVGFAALLAAGVRGFARLRRLEWSRADYVPLFLLGLLGPCVHMAMDFSNNYGVHPFWPAVSRWYYGDAVFIVEPFFWAAGIPPLFFAAETRIFRAVLAAILTLGVGLAFVVPFVPFFMAATLTVFGLASGLASWRASARLRPWLGVVSCWMVAALFFGVSHVAASAVQRAHDPATMLRDVIVTPMPAHPACFMALTVETDGTSYIARRATVATFPRWVTAGECPDPDERPTARFQTTSDKDTPSVHWRGAYVAPLLSLVRLYRDNCQAAAMLRFLRVPYWMKDDDGTVVLGDLRYDRAPGLDFSDARLADPAPTCPKLVPSWEPPRSDILAGP